MMVSSGCCLPSAVSFCAVRIEVDADDAAIDALNARFGYNRNKSIEDLFLPRPIDLRPQDKREARGRRRSHEVLIVSMVDKETREGAVGFVAGNCEMESVRGLIHFYKENVATSLEEGVIRGHMLCMMGVPAKIKTPDLLQFTAPSHATLEQMTVLMQANANEASNTSNREYRCNQYMVLLKFNCQEATDDFFNTFNGAHFNSLEPDVCSLVYVSKVETCKEVDFTSLPGHTELPACTICLELMDESISTVLTILCQHSFHGSCLAQWEDSTCPVCRHVQTPESVAEQCCSECQSAEDLWICLICGYVGCGRYVGGHAHAHFLASDHSYTMELGRNRVWDYVGDNFVHRLLQTDASNGKLVETDQQATDNNGRRTSRDKSNVQMDEKIDSLQLEYTYLLTSQLESQRRYFEERLEQLERNFTSDLEEVNERARKSSQENKSLMEELDKIRRDRSKYEQKVKQLENKVNKTSAQLEEEKQLNVALRQNQQEWQKKVKELKEQGEQKNDKIKELEDELRDLMFHMSSQSTLAASSLETQGASVVVPTPVEDLSRQGGNSGRRNRRRKNNRS